MGDRLAPGSEVAGYRVQSALGEGGMGIVYLAQRPDGALCALKLLSSSVAMDPSFVTRFKREAAYAASLDHPNIVKLFDAGEANGTPFLAMEYASGTDLGVLIDSGGARSLPEALSILGQVASALDYAHSMGLIHRDVKPGNVIVSQQAGAGPHAFLCDFGLSKNPTEDTVALTKQGHFIGTIAYTAPEEILAEPRNHLVDVYSLGCVLFETLAGRPPFVSERNLDVLYAHIGEERPKVTEYRPDLPRALDDVIAKAMAIAPAERYTSCTAFIDAAKALLPEGASLPPPPPPPRPSPVSAAPPLAAPPLAKPAATPVSSATPAEAPPAFDPPAFDPPGALRLVVSAGPVVGRELIVEDELQLGRLTTFDGALADDRGISRRHARVHRGADGHFLVEDNESANGTFVNEGEISGAHPLRPGDNLTIGSTVFAIMAAVAPTPSAEPIPQPLGATRLSTKPTDADFSAASVPDRPAEAPVEDARPEAVVAPGLTKPPVEDAAQDTSDLPVSPPPPIAVEMPVSAAVPDGAAQRLVLRIELDVEAGELTIAIDDSPAARIVRDGDGWRVETT